MVSNYLIYENIVINFMFPFSIRNVINNIFSYAFISKSHDWYSVDIVTTFSIIVLSINSLHCTTNYVKKKYTLHAHYISCNFKITKSNYVYIYLLKDKYIINICLMFIIIC